MSSTAKKPFTKGKTMPLEKNNTTESPRSRTTALKQFTVAAGLLLLGATAGAGAAYYYAEKANPINSISCPKELRAEDFEHKVIPNFGAKTKEEQLELGTVFCGENVVTLEDGTKKIFRIERPIDGYKTWKRWEGTKETKKQDMLSPVSEDK